jgi:hypothetical protein
VLVIASEQCSGKLRRFHQTLRQVLFLSQLTANTAFFLSQQTTNAAANCVYVCVWFFFVGFFLGFFLVSANS